MSEPLQYEYLLVSIKDEIELPGVQGLQAVLDQHSRDGWRLVQTYQTMGYTTRLIFERPARGPA